MNRLQRAATGRLGLLAMLALIAGSGLTPVASAQEIMLERVGAVRMAAPGERERNEEWLQKAFHNQARIEAPQAIRVSSVPRADEEALPAR